MTHISSRKEGSIFTASSSEEAISGAQGPLQGRRVSLHLHRNLFAPAPAIRKGLTQPSGSEEESTDILEVSEDCEILKIKKERICYLPPEIVRLTKLQQLILKGNQVKEVTSGISNLTRLEKLVISGNEPTWLAEEWRVCWGDYTWGEYPEKMRNICISDLQSALESLPADISTLVKEEKWKEAFILSSEYVRTNRPGLPEEFRSLVENSDFYKLPPPFVRLAKEDRLLDGDVAMDEALYPFRLTALPDSLGECVSLIELDLSGNFLEELPEGICSLRNLKILNLSGNRLQALPSCFALLEGLEELYLQENQFKEFPVPMVSLTQLQKWDMQGNLLETLPDEFEKMACLNATSLVGNRLDAIPHGLLRYADRVQLEELNLMSNQITCLPSEVGLLASVRTLILSHNKITALPTEVGELAALETLYLGFNRLQQLPSEIASLPNLKKLSLNGNKQLTSIPASIRSLPNLKLELERTPLQNRFQRCNHLAQLLAILTVVSAVVTYTLLPPE